MGSERFVPISRVGEQDAHHDFHQTATFAHVVESVEGAGLSSARAKDDVVLLFEFLGVLVLLAAQCLGGFGSIRHKCGIGQRCPNVELRC